MQAFHFFISDSSGIGGLFTALGIDWRSLILDSVAFLVVVWVLGKFVYPSLTKALDAKQAELDTAAHLQREAKDVIEQANKQSELIISKARTTADGILSTAKEDVAELLKTSRKQADDQAERITAQAREQLGRDINTARTALRAETAQLVASAAETILGEKMTGAKDTELIKRSLEVRR